MENKLIFSKESKLVKKPLNNFFSIKFLLQYGIFLGGHEHLINVETSSIVFGIRAGNVIINLNLTAVELVNIVNMIKTMGFNRCILYFINSTMSFRLSFKHSFNVFNRHLFFPIHIKIKNVLKKFKFLFLPKLKVRTILYNRARTRLIRKRSFFIKSGKSLVRKMFISSKWAYGFISNSSSYFNFARNVYKEKIKFGKSINAFKDKVKNLLDFYPFLPNFSFIGDHKTNYWVVNELNNSNVPTASVVDTFTEKALLSMFGIPGNACSIDATMCFLLLTISNYLLGFYNQILSFCFDKVFFPEENNFKCFKKNVFLKHLKLFSLINL